MTLYTHLTELALVQTASPSQAWENAKQTLVERDVGTPISRAKGCPKAAFVGLAEYGYVRGFIKSSDRPLKENVRHALCAYRLYLANPSLLKNKTAWWQAVVTESKISRENQGGVLDVVKALIQQDAFLPAAGTASL